MIGTMPRLRIVHQLTFGVRGNSVMVELDQQILRVANGEAARVNHDVLRFRGER